MSGLRARAGAVVAAVSAAAAPAKPRVVITQDPELDDVNTVIRALLYTADFKLEGLIYASATIHWKGDGKGTTQYNAGRGQQTSHRWPVGQVLAFASRGGLGRQTIGTKPVGAVRLPSIIGQIESKWDAQA